METHQEKEQRMLKGNFTPKEKAAGWRKCKCGDVVLNYKKHKKQCLLRVDKASSKRKTKSYDKNYYRRLKSSMSPDGYHSLTRGPLPDVNPLEE